MIPVLAVLPAIFSAISGVTALFEQGKQVYEQVAGKPSTATTPDALATEVQNLPADQIAAWTEKMRVGIEQFRAETDRLRVEEGEVSAELLRALPPEAAAKVAILRMTTRPKLVLRMSHVLMIPLYLLSLDGFLTVLNILAKAFGSAVHFELVAPALFGEGGSIYRELYSQATNPAAAVVMTYMIAKTAEKVTGSDPLNGAMASLNQVVAAAGSIFGKKK